jgi:hypothetical protein
MQLVHTRSAVVVVGKLDTYVPAAQSVMEVQLAALVVVL